MAQPSIIEVDYHVLIEKIKRAQDSECLIEKTNNDERWKSYVDENQVRESAIQAYGKVKFASGKAQLVAIQMNGDWDGCYAYSHDDEAAIKYVPA